MDEAAYRQNICRVPGALDSADMRQIMIVWFFPCLDRHKMSGS